MNKLSIYIVEDMAITRAALEDKLVANNFRIAGSSATAEKAWSDLQHIEMPDLLLLDIHLAGEKDGIWLAGKVREFKNIPIVYLTAFGDNQTLDLISNTKPDGYLMKPYNGPTLLTTINIAIEHFKNSRNVPDSDIIFIRDSSLRVRLDPKEIIYILSDGNYLHIHLKDKRHVIRHKMSDFALELPENLIVRVHQRYMVNINCIEQVGSDHIQINNGFEIRIAGEYKKQLWEKLRI